MKHKKSNVQKDILFIFISSFIVVVAWISFNIYHIWATSTVNQEVQLQLTPINPQFDPQTIEQLKSRENINPLYTAQQSAQTSPTPAQVSPIPTRITSPTQVITPTTPVSQTPSTAPSGTSQLEPSISPFNIQGQ